MVERPVNSYGDFSELMVKHYFKKPRGSWIFRGQSREDYVLKPKLGRIELTLKTRRELEKRLFEDFKNEAEQYLTRIPRSDWEWLAVAQHYGLPTRLLDWSYNPYEALYFAVESNLERAGMLFALRAKAGATEEIGPFDVTKPLKFIPKIVSNRLLVQEGLFTIHPNVDVPLDPNASEWELETVRIPANIKKSIRYILFRQGIHRGSLFPDLDGLSTYLAWKHVSSPKDIDAGVRRATSWSDWMVQRGSWVPVQSVSGVPDYSVRPTMTSEDSPQIRFLEWTVPTNTMCAAYNLLVSPYVSTHLRR